MSVELTDILPFGKHKGKTVEQIFKEDAGYLCWLRDKRLKDNAQNDYFHDEVLIALDAAIKEDGYLKKRHAIWGVADGKRPTPAAVVTTDLEAATPTGTPPWEEPRQATAEERTFAYQEAWGCF